MALQLRYFTPKYLPLSRNVLSEDDQADLHIADLLIRKVLAINKNNGDQSPEREEYLDIDSEAVKEKRRRRSTKGQPEDSKEVEEGAESGSDEGAESGQKKHKFNVYSIVSYILIKLRYFVTSLWHFFWRFSELHTHKMVLLALFIVAQYEVSLSYLVVVCFIFLTTPLPLFNSISYPIMTLYLGLLTLAKFLFQLPVVGDTPFAFNKTCNVS